MMREFKNRVILLTGATTPLGEAIAERLNELQTRLALTSRDSAKLSSLSQRLGANPFPIDLLARGSRQRLVEQVIQHFNQLDALINLDQLHFDQNFLSSSAEQLRQLTELNFFTPVELMRFAQPHLLKSYMNGFQPIIVNVVNELARTSRGGSTATAGSFHALAGFCEAVRPEFARFDIEVSLAVVEQGKRTVEAQATNVVRVLQSGGREVRC